MTREPSRPSALRLRAPSPCTEARLRRSRAGNGSIGSRCPHPSGAPFPPVGPPVPGVTVSILDDAGRPYLDFSRGDSATVTENELEIYPGLEHPYRLSALGEKASVEGLGPAALRGYHAKHLHPSQLTLAVVGDVDTELVLQKARAAFGGSPAGAASAPRVAIRPAGPGHRGPSRDRPRRTPTEA